MEEVAMVLRLLAKIAPRKKPIGKMMQNEIWKAKASFLNSAAAGLFVAGAAVPYLALLNHFQQTGNWMAGSDPDKFIALIGGMAIACTLAISFHIAAVQQLRQLEE